MKKTSIYIFAILLLAACTPKTSGDAKKEGVESKEMRIPKKMTAEKVIENYLEAIGGRENIEKVTSLKTVMSGDTKRGRVMMTTVKVLPNKHAMMIGASGVTIQKIVVDGDKGKQSGMMGEKELSAEEIKEKKDQSLPFKQANYSKMAYKLNLQSIEKIGEQYAYKIVVTSDIGKETTEFYDTKSGLRLRSMQTVISRGKPTISTYDYSNYQEVNGVKIPHTITSSGAMAATLNASRVEVNGEIEEAIFKMD